MVCKATILSRYCYRLLLLALIFGGPFWQDCLIGQDAAALPSPITAHSLQAVPPHEDDGFIPPMTSLESIGEGFATYPSRSFVTKAGATFPERAYWSPANVKLVDPMKYRRISALDNDDPNSLFYTFRPNFFNIQVEDEWDWYNLINTDRPDFTDTPFSVGQGIAYMEAGLTNLRVNTPDSHSTLRTVPESLFRYGITNEFELRVKWLGFQTLTEEDPQTGSVASANGGGDTDVGFKWVMFEQKNWFPLMTLVGGALLPSGTNGFSGYSVQPHFNIVSGWGIRRYIYLKHQFGLDYLTQPSFSVAGPMNNSGPFLSPTHPTINSYHNSISCLYQATKRIGGFMEWYVLYGPEQSTTNFADTGLFIYLTPTIQFDCVVGSSIAGKDNNTLFTKLGFSTRW